MSSHCKVVVSHDGKLSEPQVAAKKKAVADALGVCPEDVVLLPGVTVSVVEVPASLAAARDRADRAAEKEAAAAEAKATEPAAPAQHGKK